MGEKSRGRCGELVEISADAVAGSKWRLRSYSC